MMLIRRIHLGMLVLLAATLVLGCGRSEQPGTEEQGAQTADPQGGQAAEKPAGDTAVQAGLNMILAKADAVDGTEDKVVSRCAGCSLGMSGSEQHALKVGEYEMHFCSDGCKSGFSEDTEKAVMAMKIPEE
jgi:hypothetical protein